MALFPCAIHVMRQGILTGSCQLTSHLLSIDAFRCAAGYDGNPSGSISDK